MTDPKATEMAIDYLNNFLNENSEDTKLNLAITILLSAYKEEHESAENLRNINRRIEISQRRR